MSQTNSVSKKGGHPRFLILMCTVMALWIAMPFFIDLASTAHADGGPSNTLPGLVAQLSGSPIADVTPHGISFYSVAPTGTPDPARSLYVSVSNINLPVGTIVQVALNGSAVGTITLNSRTLDSGTQGMLVLSTSHGDTVPNVVAGDTLAVGPAPAVGDVTYLSGTFAAPTPFPTPSQTGTHTPFPTPSHTPFPTPSHTPFPTPSATPLPPHAFAARLSGANEVPPVTSGGMGFGFVALNSAETQIRVCVAYRGLSSAVTAITINGPASTSENGPVIFTLTLPTNSFGYTSQTFDVTAEQVADLRNHLLYVQIATANNADGEIRGQFAPLTPRCCGYNTSGGGGGGRPAGYIPVPIDFDGDGITDIAVFRNGNWDITQSSDGMTVTYGSDDSAVD